MNPVEYKAFASYLEDPVREGYWRLKATWNRSGTWAQALYDQAKASLFPNDTSTGSGATTTGFRTSAKIQVDKRNETIEQLVGRISTTLEIFYLMRQHQISQELDATIVAGNKSIAQWQKLFDLGQLASKFGPALKVFQDKFLNDSFRIQIAFGTPFRMNGGSVIVLVGPVTRDEVLVLGSSRDVLDALAEFLHALGQIEQPSIDRVFSPEEELFRPYFSLLALAFAQLINDERIRPLLRQAFDYFKKEDYIHCVSNLGLVAEDYLTQVYETYLRTACPRDMTLGQIYDQLHAGIKDLVRPDRQELRQLDSIYESVRNMEEADGKSQMGTDSTAGILREILNAIRLDRKYYTYRIDELHRRDQRITVFPAQIRANLTELIRNRNAASHKTRVPLGEYEALRTLYCLTSFILWWRRDKEQFDWSLDKRLLLQAAIARNSP